LRKISAARQGRIASEHADIGARPLNTFQPRTRFAAEDQPPLLRA
jgi:hypothetical protein